MEVYTLYSMFLFANWNVLQFKSKEQIMRTYHLPEWIEIVRDLAIKLMARLPELLEEYNKESKS